MLGGPTPVLVTLVPEVTVIGLGVGEVTGRREVDHGLGDFTEAGSHPDGQAHDEEEPHRPSILLGSGRDRNRPVLVAWRRSEPVR
jgi:hypothetical protein